MELMDNETGEIVFKRNNAEYHLDLETGEIEDTDELLENQQRQRCGAVRKSKFNVPKALIQEPKPSTAKFDCYLSSQETFSLTNKRRVIDLKEVSRQIQEEEKEDL